MNPAAQLSVSLLVGLALWVPTLSATMRGETEVHEASLRYLVAFVLARLAVGCIARLIHAYSGVDGEDDQVMPDEKTSDPGVPTPAGLS